MNQFLSIIRLAMMAAFPWYYATSWRFHPPSGGGRDLLSSLESSSSFVNGFPNRHRQRGGSTKLLMAPTVKSNEFQNDRDSASEASSLPILSCVDIDTFQRYDQFHRVLRHIQTAFPSILSRPLRFRESDNEMKALYDREFVLVASSASAARGDSRNSDEEEEKEIVLLSSRDELETLSSSLVWATSTAQRASDFFSSMAQTKDSSFEVPIVQCSLYLPHDRDHDDDHDNRRPEHSSDHCLLRRYSNNTTELVGSVPLLDELYVRWSTSLPPLLSNAVLATTNARGLDAKPLEISGTSRLVFSSQQQQPTISKHLLLQVKVDGTPLPIASVAGFLSRLRQAAQSSIMQTTAKSAASLLDVDTFSVFEQLRDGIVTPWLQSFPSAPLRSTEKKVIPSPIYLVTQLSVEDKRTKAPFDMRMLNFEDNDEEELIPIDNVSIVPNPDHSDDWTLPFPGSTFWPSYASFYAYVAQHFLPKTLPQLATSTHRDDVAKLFVSSAEFQAMDTSKILSSSTDIARFYIAIALLRRAASSLSSLSTSNTNVWEVETVTIPPPPNTHSTYNQVLVSWKSTLPLRLPTTGTKVESDRSSSLVPIRGQDLFTFDIVDRSVNIEDYRYVITAVQQKSFRVNDIPIQTDAYKTMVQTLARMDGGQLLQGSGISAEAALRTALEGFSNVVGTSLTIPPKGTGNSSPPLSDRAAASVYNVMRLLHADVPSLLLENVESQVPAEAYLADDVQLKGYLGEVLTQGVSSYRRAVGMPFAWLRSALRSGRVIWEKDQTVVTQVELLPEATAAYVRLRVVLPLRVKVPSPMTTSRRDSDSLPLSIDVSSVYKLNADGKVYENRLQESRVNGVRTAADVVARWVQRLGGEDTSTTDDDIFGGLSALLDNPLLSIWKDAVDRRR